MPLSDPPPEIWGIVNVTPDSFSDGGRYVDPARAIEHGLSLAAAGADVLDVGGESTRPGAAPVPEAEEIGRVVPVLRGLREADATIRLSIDTRHASVARAALDAGAGIVNDVSAGSDPEMLQTVAAHGAGLVLMHMLGGPETMQEAPRYEDVVAEVQAYLMRRAERAVEVGVAREGLWIDPGLGFGKTLEHNLQLMAGLEALAASGLPVLLGASRKSFLGLLAGGREPGERLPGSLACAVRGWQAGVRGVRVHDVRETRDLFEVLARLR